MAAIWNKNEKIAKHMLKNGHASVKDILALSFGVWPPKGLDINPAVTHAQQIIFKSFSRENMSGSKKKHGFWPRFKQILLKPLNIVSDALGTAGMATMKRERVIFINKFMCTFMPRLAARSSLASTLSHEALHSLQGDNYFRAKEVYGEQGAAQIWKSQSDTTAYLIMDDLKDYDGRFNRNFLRKAFHMVSRKVSIRPGLKYLKDGDETQAFFYQALLAGYKKWGKLPQDTDELWQALISFGLKPPADVKSHIDDLPADAPARVFAKRIHAGEAASNLKAIDRSLSDAGRTYLWTKTLPSLYADLIEMFGDRKGRERFGLGTNVKGQIQQQVFGKG